MKQFKKSLSRQIAKMVTLNYLLYLPENYNDKASDRFPLVLFLHGIGERGDDLELVKKHGIPKMIEENNDFPFVVLVPQCSLSSVWPMELDALYTLLTKIIKEYKIDTARIYLTGLSMGGFGTWHLAAVYPQLFAAIVPVCGGYVPKIGFPERIKVLKNTPVWAFHGEKDDVVSLEMSKDLVAELEKHNGNVRLTIYPNVGHDCWGKTYNNPKLYEWLLEQKNKNFDL